MRFTKASVSMYSGFSLCCRLLHEELRRCYISIYSSVRSTKTSRLSSLDYHKFYGMTLSIMQQTQA
ncbi:hypothetical protein FOMG_19735 [Fusarium oxysporum f. sp. melonis 26406]|uniref:Uncharacterized protein n=1 Tax=Fusarium oxysporum f. sp. melonis 26406 TaxID=1089452 RepID=W9Z5E8_FUSOX|nr:hypothetical protein FOMG_19735 [Fusarium oxysporum f. sp. melonis 26406]